MYANLAVTSRALEASPHADQYGKVYAHRVEVGRKWVRVWVDGQDGAGYPKTVCVLKVPVGAKIEVTADF